MKLKFISKETLKRITIIIPIIISVIIVSGMVRARKGPERLDLKETTRTVRVIKTQTTDVIPRAIGYGYVVPAQAWQAVAEVSGKVIELSPQFKKGSVCRKGTVLLRIDPAKYKSAIAQMEATVQSIKAQLAELSAQEKNYKSSLEIERKSLALNKKELDRHKQLFRKGTISASKYDKERLSYNAQRTKVQNLKNSLNLVPANRKVLKANLALNQVKLKDTRLDLEYATIKAPFNCRITDVKVEMAQFVQKGQVTATADGTKTAEITAQIPMHKMRNLVKSASRPVSVTGMDGTKLREMLGITAVVRLKTGDLSSEWDAKLSRIDATIDPQTRTLGVIVAVEDPYKKMIVGTRPPLARNMFCEVELKGRAIPGKIVIPRSALHDGHVYVMNAEKRLVRKKVGIDFPQTNFYVVREGLEAGEWVIVSDLIPAIEGMLLEPQEDKAFSEMLVAEAAGESGVR
ncbi:HlyD family efflux transporter periplasmic adaptor subunit [Desulfobacterales bacterium HSG2]|nr:HlyD family efflux transporter periplasmic adaptor subunit [Desulfobacterales bacterium HSG2]